MENINKVLDEYLPVSDLHSIINDFIGTDYISMENYSYVIEDITYIIKIEISERKEMESIYVRNRLQRLINEREWGVEINDMLDTCHVYGVTPKWYIEDYQLLKKSPVTNFCKYLYFEPNHKAEPTNMDNVRYYYIVHSLCRAEQSAYHTFADLHFNETEKFRMFPIMCLQNELYENDVLFSDDIYLTQDEILEGIMQNYADDTMEDNITALFEYED